MIIIKGDHEKPIKYQMSEKKIFMYPSTCIKVVYKYKI